MGVLNEKKVYNAFQKKTKTKKRRMRRVTGVCLVDERYADVMELI